MDLPYRHRALEEVKAHRDALNDITARAEEGALHSLSHSELTALEAASDAFEMLIEQVENQVIIF
jgi:hypothetical protein